MKKCKKADDVLFINAAECFEKGKRKNQLREQDISKIIKAYRDRTEEDRFSRRVSLEEIQKNDFNLNISRYVSLNAEEEEIDLSVIHGDLVALDKQIKDATNKHNFFLKELGLPILP